MKANFWDRLGESINSLGAVLLPMLILITGGMFLSHTYFKQTLPGTMPFWEAFLSAWLIAVAWELTVLVTTVNQRHVSKWIPRFMALCSGIVFLFYIGAFNEDLTLFERIQKGFVGALVSFVSYVYVELFHAKWTERNEGKAMPGKLDESERKLIETESRLIQTESALNEAHRKLIEAESRFNESESAFIELERTFDEVHAFKIRVQSELICPHCSQEFESYGTVHAHKGHCMQNPKKKAKINGYGKHSD
jgi:hypothetical protein